MQAITESMRALDGVDVNAPEVQNAIAEAAKTMEDSEKTGGDNGDAGSGGP
jgi:hypothetical protein